MNKSTFLALAFAAVLAAPAQANLVTSFLSTNPSISVPFASTTSDTLNQPLTGFTIDRTGLNTEAYGAITIAVDGDKLPGYENLTLILKGFYKSPSRFVDGEADVVSMYSGSKVLYDRTVLATPLVNTALPTNDFAFSETVIPFSLSYTVSAGVPIPKTKFQVENFFYVPAGASITFSEGTVIGAVPEPASIAVLGLGVAALRRRRARKA